jgi:hypothetical protein
MNGDGYEDLLIGSGGIVVSGVGDINSDGLSDVLMMNYIPSFVQCNACLFVYPLQHTAKPLILYHMPYSRRVCSKITIIASNLRFLFGIFLVSIFSLRIRFPNRT